MGTQKPEKPVKPETAMKAEKDIRVNEKKWSKLLMDAGWTAVPSVLLERQKAIGLDALDMNIILHLSIYWWTHDNKPHPSKKTIAEALGVNPRTVQRRIAALEKSNFITREERRVKGKGSRTNLYHFDGLIKAAQPYAKEKIEKLAERAQERTETVARKGRAKLKLVTPDDEE
ncbi:MAG TPA: helix-turn-helix domain-containing protein [Armatimonadota bacterium]|nr:helix-turn-helix domain-containing protein [Armatimonadota bacterium]